MGDPVPPLIAQAGRVEEKMIRIERGVEAPIVLALPIERLTRFNAIVDVAAQNEMMWQIRLPSHCSLNHAMQTAELCKGRN